MKYESTVTFPKVNPLSDVDFDVNYPNERYRYAVDSLVLTGLSRVPARPTPARSGFWSAPSTGSPFC